MIIRTLIVALFIGLLASNVEGSKGHKKRLKSRTPVYFPIIPSGNLEKDFGSKFSESQNTAQSLPPLSSPKPTTTTEKLPLAQESHVASNGVTEAPGPSYLTDSLYYFGDPTPSPGKLVGEDGHHHHELPLFYATGSGEDKEGELGVFLQSVSAYQPPSSFGNKMSFDSLLNPAAMHYISPYSGESTEEVSVIEAPLSDYHLPDPKPSTNYGTTPKSLPSVAYIQPLPEEDRKPPSVNYREPLKVQRKQPPSLTYKQPPSLTYKQPPSLTYKQPQLPQYGLPPSSSSLYIQTATPSPVTPRYKKPTPPPVESYEVPAPVTPIIRYRAPTTRAPRINRPRPSIKKTVRPYYEPSQSTTSSSVQTYQKAISPPRPAYARPVLSHQFPSIEKEHSSKNTKYSPPKPSSSSSFFLPKPAPNPFAARISKPVVKPVYDNPSQVQVSEFPLKQSSTSFFDTRYSVPEVNKNSNRFPEPSQSSYDTSETKKSRPTTTKVSSSRRRTYGNRKTKTFQNFRPKHEQGSTFESKKKDYDLDFNKEAESIKKKGFRTPIVTSSPVEDSPVYRTSTKAYRAPSSLYNVRGPAKKTITLPSQPEFVQSDSNIYIPHEYDEEAIPGVGGLDYPIYSTIPDTSFKCSSQDHPGLYADQQTKCQVFHICQEGGREDSFLCPNGTVFNQQYFVCDWWYNFSCDSADRFYALNELIYELPEVSKHYST